MALDLPDLRVRSPNIPQPDFSWLDALSSAGGDIIGHVSENKAFARLDDQFSRMSGATAATGPQGSFISRLTGDADQRPVAPSVGRPAVPNQPPIPGIQMQPPKMAQDGSTFQPFIETVKAGGVSNPYALAAIAATGKAESGWSPANANRTWSDPSQSGQAGTAGGVMSWRNERLQNLYSYAAQKGETPGNISPQTQAEFFLREDPQLIQRLNQARSPEEAADIMAGAWKFAGYDQQGGEAARRRALAASYAPQFAGAAGSSVDAVNAMGAGGTVPGYVDPMVSAPNSRQQQPVSQPMPVNQMADASGNVLAPAVTPLGRGEVPSDLIRFMLRDPQLRELGKQLWQQNAGKSSGSEWDFAKLDDGTLVRQNKQTGEVQRVGQFAKPEGLQNVSKGGTLYDPNTRQWITPPSGPGAPEAPEYGLAPIYGTDEQGRTVIGQLSKNGTFQLTPMPEGFSPTPGISNTDLGTTVITRNNRTGAIVDTRAKDVEGAAEQTADGKARSEAKAALPQIEASANQMLATIDSLDGDPYLGNMLGAWDSRTPNLTSNAARVQSKMDQIGGQAFLQAFNMLRGAGQITEVEGTKATNAMARLNTAQTPEDYRAALKDLREVVNTALANARQKAGVSSAAAPSGANDYKSRYGLE